MKPSEVMLSLSLIAALSACALPSKSSAGAGDAERAQQWLQQLVGEWDTESEVWAEMGVAPQSFKGRDSVRAFGSWVVHEGETFIEGTPFKVIMTLGYDQSRGQIVGTWIDSMQNTLWIYQGSLDDSGSILTLQTEGPSMEDPTKSVRYKEVLKFKSDQVREHLPYVLRDGEWVGLGRTISRRRQ